MTDQVMWTVRNVAERLNVPDSWVYAKAETGELPSFLIGRYRRFLPAEIEAYVERRRQGPRRAADSTAEVA